MAHTFFGSRIKRIPFAALLAAIAMSGAAQPVARVDVVFVQPEKFTDVGDAPPVSDKTRDYYLGELKRHLESSGSRLVQDGHKLSIAISDVDRAGGFDPLRGPGLAHTRVFRDVYPPRIALEFKLTDAGGKLLAEGKRVLSDMTYLGNPESRSDPLRYEKKLLDDWLAQEFPLAQPSAKPAR